ncbi:hypothetical protein U8326_10065 [Tsuneonella sp. CC-YZS046]|uniref:hypothetical protein n=1 Tax=Tsuneonella sp. CC-YZS046 TaxID=3042152 RepID=UPI002D79157A|nr:hypothetical protein [Tsuneonella sp. CC-YZS046]WRO65406.1 hypothetical protein U8326_10065 [Tsuneonella sp. CC-YZS046]
MLLPDHLKRNANELAAIKAIAESGDDPPVLMVNINTYTAEAGYPDGDLHHQYITGLEKLLKRVGATILWRLPVLGQPVGEQQQTDEILGVWYPSHKAFLDLPKTAGADENYRLRRLCVQEAVIHRCDGNANMNGAVGSNEEPCSV